MMDPMANILPTLTAYVFIHTHYHCIYDFTNHKYTFLYTYTRLMYTCRSCNIVCTVTLYRNLTLSLKNNLERYLFVYSFLLVCGEG